jgi:hypothetical protein
MQTIPAAARLAPAGRLVGIFAAWLVALLFVSSSPARAQASRGDLLFEINAALKSHDREGLEACFNFEGVDDATKSAVETMIGQMLSWPTFYVFTSERAEHGPVKLQQNGKTLTMNGDWTFQVHIFRAKPPTGGFVFPAGKVGDKCMILLTIPAKP